MGATCSTAVASSHRDGQPLVRIERVDVGDARYALSPHETDELGARIVRLLNRPGSAVMRDRSLGLLVVGGGVVAASALLWRRTRAMTTSVHDGGAGATTTPMHDGVAPLPASLAGWIVPVPTLADRPAVVSNEFHAGTQPNDPHEHLGVDLMFRRRDARDLIAVFPPKTANGTPLFFMPDGISVLAAAAGTVSFADMTGMGNSVIIQHANGWATYYTHLSSLAVKRGDVVRAGQAVGTIGASPTDGEHLKHLHFSELWKGGKRSSASLIQRRTSDARGRA